MHNPFLFTMIILVPLAFLRIQFHSKTKHIPLKYHFLKDQVANKVVQLQYIPSTEQIADIFTKPLSKA